MREIEAVNDATPVAGPRAIRRSGASARLVRTEHPWGSYIECSNAPRSAVIMVQRGAPDRCLIELTTHYKDLLGRSYPEGLRASGRTDIKTAEQVAKAWCLHAEVLPELYGVTKPAASRRPRKVVHQEPWRAMAAAA